MLSMLWRIIDVTYGVQSSLVVAVFNSFMFQVSKNVNDFDFKMQAKFQSIWIEKRFYVETIMGGKRVRNDLRNFKY